MEPYINAYAQDANAMDNLIMQTTERELLSYKLFPDMNRDLAAAVRSVPAEIRLGRGGHAQEAQRWAVRPRMRKSTPPWTTSPSPWPVWAAGRRISAASG